MNRTFYAAVLAGILLLLVVFAWTAEPADAWGRWDHKPPQQECCHYRRG